MGGRWCSIDTAVVNTPLIPPSAMSGLNGSPLCPHVESYVTLLGRELTEVMAFVQQTARLRSKTYTTGLVIALRSFLRYLRYRGKIEHDWGQLR